MISIKFRLFGSLLAAGVITLVAGAAQAFEITQSEGTNTNETACVDVFKGNTKPGTIIQAYPCAGTKNEQWTLVKGQLEGTGNDGGVSTCMAAFGGTSGNAELEDCNSIPNTTWDIDTFSNNSTRIYTCVAGGICSCLDSHSKYGSGAQLDVDKCRFSNVSNADQGWELRDIVIVQPAKTNEHTCVDVQGNSIPTKTTPTVPVNASPCTLGVNERWTYVNGTGQLQGNGSSGSTQTCLAELTGGAVVLQNCNGNSGAQESWILSSSGAIANVGSGKCLDSSTNGQNGGQLFDTACDTGTNSGQVWVLQ